MASRDVALVGCDRPEQWDDIARSVPGGTGYHEWRFLDLQEQLSGVRFARLLIVERGRPIGLVPIARRRGAFWRTPALPFPFLGPVVPAERLPAATGAIRRWQRRHGLLLHRFDLAPELATRSRDGDGLRALDAHDDGTVVVPLEGLSADQVDAAMSRLRRRSMVKAERAGCSARPARPGETAAILGPVLAAAYGRRGRPSPYPHEIGALVEEWADGRDDVYLGVAFSGDRLVGGIVALGWRPVALAWIGGVLPEFHATRVGDLMHRDLLHWARARGNVGMDMSGRVDDAIERYKISLGGVVVPYTTLTSSLLPHPLLRSVRTAAVLVRRLTGRARRTSRVARRLMLDLGLVVGVVSTIPTTDLWS